MQVFKTHHKFQIYNPATNGESIPKIDAAVTYFDLIVETFIILPAIKNVKK